MNATILGLWLIVECPYCHAPMTVNKHVIQNSVIELTKTRYETCESCGKSFFIEVKSDIIALGEQKKNKPN